MANDKLDYSRIKQEFEKANVSFPLKQEECIGLSEEEKAEINPCGTYCGGCEDYGWVCDGCRNRGGKPIWYDLYSKKEVCNHMQCANDKGIHDCSQCNKIPCSMHFEFPDPTMPDDIKQYWFKLRMENFNKINDKFNIKINDTFSENVKKYLPDNTQEE